MLNTQKLLYILPDVAYVAELLPGKKPGSFTIQAFRQVNGEFLDDNELIGENVLKLIQKLDPEEYHLILPDFLFTNTIVTVKEKSDSKIKSYLKETLLPELELNPETHHIDTTILTEHGDTTKVQLTALEKSVLEPIQVSVEQTRVRIAGVSPLSWTVKSLISLEPSISVVQMGSMLYTALHYIGVDQTTQANVDEVDNIFETIKTLKGAEPSIQTVYLLSNELVEETLKEHLSDTLPIQQLAGQADVDSKMPSYVQRTIEAGMRTLTIDEYPAPSFELGKAPAGATIKTSQPTLSAQPETSEETGEEEELPRPIPPTTPPPIAVEPPSEPEPELETKDIAITSHTVAIDVSETEAIETEEEPKPSASIQNVIPQEDDIDALLESLQVADTSPVISTPKVARPSLEEPQPESKPEPSKPSSPIIKNNNRTKTLLKMIFVTLAVFFATVGIGIGLGLGVLQLSQNKTGNNPVSPIAETSPSPSPVPSPSPSPSPSPTVNKKDTSLLIVNATTKAGYAGQQATKLKTAGFGTVESGNAKGDYEEGNYVLMEEEDAALIASLEEATGLELTYKNTKQTEDAKDTYTAVIVLAQ